MKDLLLVFLGSGLGGVLRYQIGSWIPSKYFPWGTLTANLLASILLGIFFILSLHYLELSKNIRLLLTIGFCGGLSTFSTFSQESLWLLDRNAWLGILYIITSVVSGILLYYIGSKLFA